MNKHTPRASKPTAEEFTAKWLRFWEVPWPDERAEQLVGDLRLHYGLPAPPLLDQEET